jgi:spermidine/putrescine transport system substrate-binding protein
VKREPTDGLRLLAPLGMKPRLDRIEQAVQQVARRSDGRSLSRREALGLGGLALAAAACGGSSSSSGNGGGTTEAGTTATKSALAGKPMESKLLIYNWSQYDDPKTYKAFKAAHKGLTLKETYYAGNDELIAKLQAGGGPFDIVVPTQNAVAQLIAQDYLMPLDHSLIPNLANVDPLWKNLDYDPGNKYSVIKDYGITLFFFRNDVVTESPKTMLDFYNLLPKYGKKGRTNLMEQAEEVVPLALMALGLDPNTGSAADLAKAKKLLMRIRPGVTTITSSNYIDDASAGKIILGQGWNGDVRRVAQARKKQGDITVVVPDGATERWADNWCITKDAPDPVAAHAWINNILDPKVAEVEMAYHNYAIPIPKMWKLPGAKALADDPLVNIDNAKAKNYRFILNPSPAIVNARQKIYTEFKAAG